MKVEVLAVPGCRRCAQARAALKSVVDELASDRVSWRDVNLLEEIDYAVELGLVAPPAIAIDGTLVFPTLPTPEKLREELIKRLR